MLSLTALKGLRELEPVGTPEWSELSFAGVYCRVQGVLAGIK